MHEHIVIVTGSAPVPPSVSSLIPSGAIVLGVDGGLDHALDAGLRPNGLIGDLDSISPEGLAWADEHATIARHPADKDQTDTELALSFAAAMNPARITLVGGGDRIDHTIAALAALGAKALTSVPEIDGWWGDQHLDVIHGPGRRTLTLQPGSTLSLLAIGQTCRSVTISGVRWPLDERELAPTVGLGISNEVTDPDGRVVVATADSVLTIFDQPSPSTFPPAKELT